MISTTTSPYKMTNYPLHVHVLRVYQHLIWMCIAGSTQANGGVSKMLISSDYATLNI